MVRAAPASALDRPRALPWPGAGAGAGARVARHGVLLSSVLVALLALALRLHGLGSQSIWFDEAVSVGFAARPLGDLIAAARLDVNPPLYYALLHFWLPLAADDAWLRLPSALCSAAAAGLSVWVGRVLGGALWVGVLAGLLTALSSFHIALGQEARAYGLLSLLAVAAIGSVWVARERGTWRWWLATAASLTLALYSHNYALLLGLAIAIWLAIDMIRARALDRRAVLALALPSVLYLLWLPALLGQAVTVSADYWITPPDDQTLWATYFSFIAATPPAHGWGMDPLSRGARWGILGLLGLSLLARPRRAELLLGLAVGTPTLLAVAISILLTPIYVVRYATFVLPLFWILVARGLRVVPSALLRLAGAVVLLAAVGFNLPPLYDDPFYRRPDLRAATRDVEARAAPDALVVFGTPFTQYPFAYYDGERLRTQVISPEDVAGLRATTAAERRVWYVGDAADLDVAGLTILEHRAHPGVDVFLVAPTDPLAD
jgi:hypothetical protein